ncbi:MAG: hypothetical protein IT425_00945 [Pirellulales bacterium]|nr:hypothetical protein [Pirellulales bacterium]
MSNCFVGRIVILAALLDVAGIALEARAQCCGQSYGAYYAPTYSTYYAPATYSTYSSGWYPGYWLDRVNARLWGSPTTYVASYPSYYASYRPVYYTNYAYTTSYVPAYSSCASCTSCAPCNTCTTCYAPSCNTCGTCDTGCSSCSGGTVTQAGYTYSQPNGGCSNCAATAPASTSGTLQPTPATYSSPTAAPGTSNTPIPAATPEPSPSLNTTTPQPSSSSRVDPTPEPTNTPPAITPDKPDYDPYTSPKTESSTYLRAPEFISPQDRTALNSNRNPSKSIAPVRTAVYHEPVGIQMVSASSRGTAPIAPARPEPVRLENVQWRSLSGK